MRINDTIYFSPSLRLSALDLNNTEHILKYFHERIVAYYFSPLECLIERQMAFAAGAIECLLIDSLSRYSSLENKAGERIRQWCEQELKVHAFTADAFYQYLRCGLLHEAHIKRFGQFSFDPVFSEPIQMVGNYLVVNPEKLYITLQDFLLRLVETAAADKKMLDILITRLKDDFEEEIKLAQR